MVDEKRPRIVIGIPCYGDVAPEVLEDFARFTYHCGRRMPQYDFLLAIRTKSEQFRARQTIVEEAQKAGADWLLFLDDDMIINPNVTLNSTPDYGFVEKLIAHDVDIVGALYFQRTGGCKAVAMYKAGERGYRFLSDEELTGDLQEVDVAGGGALLIRMSVFDRLPHPYFAPEHEFGTDVQLCRSAAKQGIITYLDSSIELGHLRKEKVIITRRNKDQYAMEDSLPGEVKQSTNFLGVVDSLIKDGLEYTGYDHIDELAVAGQRFMTKASMGEFMATKNNPPLADWYKQYPKERVARQIWYNTTNPFKRQMTEFILGAISDQKRGNILDFGCGIGVTAYELARRGHNVTAADLDGTATLEFLQWRAKKNNVPLTFHKSKGGVPHLGSATYGGIIVMDCLEHIPEWKIVLRELADRLEEGGYLFCNNGILDDKTHPEHIDLDRGDFYAECAHVGLTPMNQISFIKRGPDDR